MKPAISGITDTISVQNYRISELKTMKSYQGVSDWKYNIPIDLQGQEQNDLFFLFLLIIPPKKKNLYFLSLYFQN